MKKADLVPVMQYKLVNRVNPKDPRGELMVGPQVVYRDTVNFELLCNMIAERSVLCPSDVEQVLQALLSNAKLRLMNSEAFDLGALGYLTTAIKTDQVADPDDFKPSNIRGAHVVFMASRQLKRKMREVEFKRVRE